MFVTVLFAVLKIAVYIILGTLTAAIVLLFAFLFIPFRYRVSAEKNESVTGSAAVSWLFGIIRVVFKLKDGRLSEQFLRVLGFKIRFGKKTDKQKTHPPSAPFPVPRTASERPRDSVVSPANELSNAAARENPQEERRVSKQKSLSSTEDKTEKQCKKRTRKTCDSFSEEKDTTPLQLLWELENKGEILNQVFLLFKRVFKIVFNTKLIADFRFGTGKPDATGRLLGLCYAVSGVSCAKIKAEGDFEGKSFSGRAEAKGRIFICSLLWAILLFIFNKHIFRLIKKYVFKKG